MRATREGAVRAINISHCAMTRWSVISDDMNDDKLAGHSFGVDQRLSISIVEAKPGQSLWEDDPEKIGSLGYYMLFNVYVPRDAFAHFWNAADPTDGSAPYWVLSKIFPTIFR
jgi:hypothetical protein